MNTSLLIGSYTHGNQSKAGEGITVAGFDSETGELLPESVIRDLVNPSYLAEGEGRVYAVSEVRGAEGEVLCLGRKEGAWTIRWRVGSGGGSTCHLTLDQRRGVVHAASYRDGRVISLDAETGRALFRYAYEGSGPCLARQEGAHAHQVCLTPDGAFLLVPDLGSDKVWRHRLDASGVPEGPPDAIALPPGTGPRHLVFPANGSLAYVLGELDGRIHAVDWRAARTVRAPVGMAPPDWEGPHGAAAIRRHPRQPWVHASHRGSGRIAFLEIGPDGSLALRGHFDAGGKEPRDIQYSPDGRCLLAACQHSDCVGVHRVEPGGALTLLGTVAIPGACSVLFCPEGQSG